MPTSVYVHVPFCVVKCGYCDFTSYEVEDPAVHDRFLDALDAELTLLQPPRAAYTVFVGGGTPTYLDEARFARLWEILAAHLDLEGAAEVTVECNPESLSLEKAKIARAAGVRRASVGAQTFDRDRLRFLDRPHDDHAIARAIENLRSAGFDNVSLDLIYALPGETLAAWDADLRAALALEPDHLSCYSLTFERGTRLGRDLAAGRVHAVDEDVDRAMFEHTRAVLAAAGFVAYEVSNFGGRGGPSLHNDHYWLQGDYYGAGPGAASHLAGWRGTNLKPVDAWAGAIARGLLPTGEAETLTRARRVGEALWLGLRRADGVDLASVGTRLGVDVESFAGVTVDRYAAMGLICREGTSIRLSSAGLIVADSVTSAFLVG